MNGSVERVRAMATERGGAASVHLDALRGLAALAVFVGHLRSLLFVDYYTDSVVRGSAIEAVYLLTSLGHQAVMVFFVLSGYLISGSIFGALERVVLPD